MSDGKIRGIVHVVEETKTYGQKGFRKRVVVLEQDKGRFTNYIPLEFTNDACDTVDDLAVGDDVEVVYRLNGRRWQKDPRSEVKFFLNAEGMSFNKLGAGAGDSSKPSSGASSADHRAANDELAEAAYDDEDVPF